MTNVSVYELLGSVVTTTTYLKGTSLITLAELNGSIVTTTTRLSGGVVTT